MAPSYHFHEVEGMPFESQAFVLVVCPGLTSFGPSLGLLLGPFLGPYLFLPGFFWGFLSWVSFCSLWVPGSWALGFWAEGL